MMKNLEVLEEIRKQGKNLIETKRDEFVKQNLLSDEFIQMMQKNKKPFELLMSYYQCAIMEIETKFRVLNQEYSLSYDQNPIEGIKTRVKSYESIMRKIRVKDIPVTLESIEENIRDIAGVRVICSFPSDVYKLADSFLKQDDITLIERKDYIQHPKESGYRSLHLIVRSRWISGRVWSIRCATRKIFPKIMSNICRMNSTTAQDRARSWTTVCRISGI